MQCTSCQSEIDTKWKHAIDTNLCPFCGKMIMEEELKNLLNSLTETMEKLSAYPQYLEDWLSSNFNFVPAAKLQFLEKKLKDFNKLNSRTAVSNELDNDEVPKESSGVILQNQAETSEFFKKAEVSKVAARTQSLKEMVSQIKKSGTGSPALTEDLINNADPEAAAELRAALDFPEVSSSIGVSEDFDEIHPSALALANSVNNKNPNYNTKDLLKLQEMQERTSGARNKMLGGGVKGGFSRS